MGDKHVPTLDIEIKLDVNTEESSSKALQTIIQVLLFQRSQIPFCYEVFQAIVKKLKKELAEIDSSKWKNYQLTKQREIAFNLLCDIQTLFREVTEIAKRSDHDIRAMVLFGSTLYTAKEAFIIKIPKANRKHYPQHHRQRLESALKLLTRQLILSEELRPSGRFVGPTNTFMLLGMSSTCDPEKISRTVEYRSINGYQLPISCQKYVINITIQGASEDELACCRQMDVFSDALQVLTIDDDAKEVPTKPLGRRNELVKNDIMWYQVGRSLKGFNDVLIKGKSIWDGEL